jgi:type I restriction enzyme S subunit
VSIPPGYQATEVGFIPGDWEAVPLGRLGSFSKGQGIRKDQASSGDIPCIRYGEIYTDHNDIVRKYRSRISREVATTSRVLRKGDLLFAGSGETKEEIGKCVAFVDDCEAYAGGDIIVLSPHSANSVLLGYLLNSEVIARQKAARAQGDAVVHISAKALADVIAPLPTSDIEQTAIAEALSDMDEAIAAQEAVIAKKRALKTATMQALLSGTRRLPGFSGGWERRSFDQLFQFLRNGSASRAALSANGAIGYIHYGDIHANPRPHMDCGKGALPRIAREVVSRLPRVQDGDLLIADASEDYDGTGKSVEATNIDGDEVVAGLHTLLLRPLEKMAPGFAGYLQFIPEVKRQYVAAAQGVSVYGLSRSAVKSVEVALPKYDEQAAISSCLMDMEIDLSHQQDTLKKLCDLKVGMMQQLLTGKIRLV